MPLVEERPALCFQSVPYPFALLAYYNYNLHGPCESSNIGVSKPQSMCEEFSVCLRNIFKPWLCSALAIQTAYNIHVNHFWLRVLIRGETQTGSLTGLSRILHFLPTGIVISTSRKDGDSPMAEFYPPWTQKYPNLLAILNPPGRRKSDSCWRKVWIWGIIIY